jgi:hypothetical protein
VKVKMRECKLRSGINWQGPVELKGVKQVVRKTKSVRKVKNLR